MKITVIAGSGMGGTEKAAYLFAAELSRRGHEVDALTDSNACRAETLIEAGVHIKNVPYTQKGFSDYLHTACPDVVHNHTSGYADHRALYSALDELGKSRPKLIETNVFGRMRDRYDNGHVDLRMFVSMASGCQAFLRPRFYQGEPSLSKHTVLYNPLPTENAGSDTPPAPTRQSLGIAENAFVLVRVGRPGHKWASWECEAFQIASRSVPNLQLILMEPTDDLKTSIRNNTYGPGITILEATSDQGFIDSLYRLSDAMLHASSFGESYGYTLAEGMREGLPVITRTTPWADNAQVELVRQGETGFVCCGVKGMADAVVQLASCRELRDKTAAAARRHVAVFSNLSAETDLLEEISQFVTGEPAGTLMQNRFENWMHYRNHEFIQSEWNVFERTTNRKVGYAVGRLHGFYRKYRVAVSSKYWNFRTNFKSK